MPATNFDSSIPVWKIIIDQSGVGEKISVYLKISLVADLRVIEFFNQGNPLTTNTIVRPLLKWAGKSRLPRRFAQRLGPRVARIMSPLLALLVFFIVAPWVW